MPHRWKFREDSDNKADEDGNLFNRFFSDFKEVLSCDVWDNQPKHTYIKQQIYFESFKEQRILSWLTKTYAKRSPSMSQDELKFCSKSKDIRTLPQFSDEFSEVCYFMFSVCISFIPIRFCQEDAFSGFDW